MNIIRPIDYDEAVRITSGGGFVYAIALSRLFEDRDGYSDVFIYVELNSDGLSKMRDAIDSLKDKSWFMLASEFFSTAGVRSDVEGGTVLFTWREPKKLRCASDMVAILTQSDEEEL